MQPGMTELDIGEWHARGQQLDSLLRAALVFGDVANCVLLQEIELGDHSDTNVTRLTHSKSPLERRSWADRLDADALLNAYTLRKYRDRMLAHFETPRMSTAQRRLDDWAGNRIFPMMWPPGPVPEHRALQEMSERYRDIPRVAALEKDRSGQYNYWNLLEAMFYSVPPLVNGACNSDRTFVDRCTLQGGIKSFTMTEVVGVVDGFCEAVSALLERGDLFPDRHAGVT
jgi:hypothetical protein